MAQNQTLPSIQQLTSELPPPEAKALSQQNEMRDSGNWSISQSKHSSTISNNQSWSAVILNAEDSPSNGTMPEWRRTSWVDPNGAPRTLQQNSALPAMPQPFNGTQQPFNAFGVDSRPSLDAPPLLESRRSSVDSRMNAGMGGLALSPSSPYESQNASRASLVPNLERTTVLMRARANGSTPVSPSATRFQRTTSGPGPQPRRAPVINPNPRSVSGMPDPTAPLPTKGFPWAFPEFPEQEDESMIRPRSSSRDSSVERSLASRQNSYAPSINSSILTTDSHLPAGQRRLDDGDIQHTHHHSMQHRAVTNIMMDSAAAAAGGNYSRTPELRVSHKMAERKRRSEMKSLFDELNSILPNTPGNKSSKWEVLTKAIEHIRSLKYTEIQMHREVDALRNQTEHSKRIEEENNALRNELSTCWQHLQRIEPNNHHVFGPFTNNLTAAAAGAQQHATGAGAQGRLPPLQSTAMPPPPPPYALNHEGSSPMDGVQSDRYPHY